MYLGLSFCSLDSEGCTAGLDRVLGHRALVTCELQWAAALKVSHCFVRWVGIRCRLGLGAIGGSKRSRQVPGGPGLANSGWCPSDSPVPGSVSYGPLSLLQSLWADRCGRLPGLHSSVRGRLQAHLTGLDCTPM